MLDDSLEGETEIPEPPPTLPGLPLPEAPAPIPPLPDLPPLNIAVLGSAAKIRPAGAAEGPLSAALIAAKNEFESFQVAVNAVGAPVRGVRVSLSAPLTGPGGAVIPPGNVTLYRVEYLDIKIASDLEGAPGRWPDPLIPAVDTLFGEARNAFPFDVPAGENRAVWVDVQVPPGAVAGVYEGSLDLIADGYAARVPVRLEVLNVGLPSTTSLKSAFG
ncbi:MAG TPA: hypothetical protein VEY30_05710, partial [Myxococcaceae bacterium]|nr:hypothetical protein [Myxococcaceae bacterium]